MKWLKNIWSWLDRNKTRLFYISAGICAYDYISFFLAGFLEYNLHISMPWSIITFIEIILNATSAIHRVIEYLPSYLDLIIIFGAYGFFILASLFNVIFNPKWLVKLLALFVAILNFLTIFILFIFGVSRTL